MSSGIDGVHVCFLYSILPIFPSGTSQSHSFPHLPLQVREFERSPVNVPHGGLLLRLPRRYPPADELHCNARLCCYELTEPAATTTTVTSEFSATSEAFTGFNLFNSVSHLSSRGLNPTSCGHDTFLSSTTTGCSLPLNMLLTMSKSPLTSKSGNLSNGDCATM
jgi:hypothetical protein